MIHQYKSNGYNIVMDVNSGSVHVVDDIVYDMIPLVEPLVTEGIKDADTIKAAVLNLANIPYPQEEITEAVDEVLELEKAGQLFAPDIYENYIFDFKKRQTVVKALCLHIAHDCNLACRYCFAEEGEYHGRRALMSFEVGKKALDFLVANSGNRVNLEVDFLGGEPLMMMSIDLLRNGLVKIHIPVTEISHDLTRQKIVTRLEQLRSSLKADFGIVEPRIAVLALNPHAGDGGLLGSEEEHIIRPAVNEAYEKGILAFGPFAADGFFASGHYRDYDAVLAMYHDQGLTPFKTLSPDGVNFTACLGSVRTSPDHGVAFDIAGQDKADPQSMRNAIYLATDIVNNRRAWAEWTSNPLPHAERERGGRDLSVKDLPDTEKES